MTDLWPLMTVSNSPAPTRKRNYTSPQKRTARKQFQAQGLSGVEQVVESAGVNATFIRSKVEEALAAIEVHPLSINPVKIEKCVTKLWKQTVSFAFARGQQLVTTSGYFDFAGKVLQNYAWQKEHGISKEHWGQALMIYPELFTHNPLPLASRFDENVSWLKDYQDVEMVGICNQDLEKVRRLGAVADWVRTLSKKQDGYFKGSKTMQQHFELSLAITAHPRFLIAGHTTLTHNDRKNYILDKRSVMLGTAEDNLALRHLHQELAADKSPSAASLNYTRERIEREVVGYLVKGGLAELCKSALPSPTQEAIETARAAVAQYSETTLELVRRQPIVSEARHFPTLGAFLVPEGDVIKDKQLRPLLLERLIKGNLIQSSNFICSKS